MQLTSRLLPGPHQNSGETRGKALNQRFGSLFQALTSLGKVAAGATERVILTALD